MKIGYASDIGRKRDVDEDSIIIVEWDTVFESEKRKAALVIVADGMGGHNAGEVASRMAAEGVAERVGGAILKCENFGEVLQNAITEVNSDICEYVEHNPHYKGMGTTLTAAVIYGNNVFIGHVGDTRVYLINEKEITQITKDHSLVQELVDNKEITKEEARIHPQKNIITRAVGIDRNIEVDTFTVYVYGDDYILLCCDGLTDLVTDEEIHAAVMENHDLNTVCDTLVKAANERGGYDNISVVVVRCDELQERGAFLSDETQIRASHEDRGGD